jgi:hypothetical protein
MDRTTLHKKLDAMLDEFNQNRTFGSIEIIFRFGEPSTIHKLTTEKLQNERENTQHEYHHKR